MYKVWGDLILPPQEKKKTLPPKELLINSTIPSEIQPHLVRTNFSLHLTCPPSSRDEHPTVFVLLFYSVISKGALW